VQHLTQHFLLRRIKESSDLRIGSLQGLADQFSDSGRHHPVCVG